MQAIEQVQEPIQTRDELPQLNINMLDYQNNFYKTCTVCLELQNSCTLQLKGPNLLIYNCSCEDFICNECQINWFVQQMEKVSYVNLDSQLKCAGCESSGAPFTIYQQFYSKKNLYINKEEFQRLSDLFQDALIKKYIQLSDDIFPCSNSACENVFTVEKKKWLFLFEKKCDFTCNACNTKVTIAPKYQNQVLPISASILKPRNFLSEIYKMAFASKCPSCSVRIIKNGGCSHMTCSRCKFQYCWHCKSDLKYSHNSSKCAFIIGVNYFLYTAVFVLFLWIFRLLNFVLHILLVIITFIYKYILAYNLTWLGVVGAYFIGILTVKEMRTIYRAHYYKIYQKIIKINLLVLLNMVYWAAYVGNYFLIIHLFKKFSVPHQAIYLSVELGIFGLVSLFYYIKNNSNQIRRWVFKNEIYKDIQLLEFEKKKQEIIFQINQKNQAKNIEDIESQPENNILEQTQQDV